MLPWFILSHRYNTASPFSYEPRRSVMQVFSAYVYLLTGGSSSKVGYLTGISGLSQVRCQPSLCGLYQTGLVCGRSPPLLFVQVMSAPLFAYLADKHRRDRLLK